MKKKKTPDGGNLQQAEKTKEKEAYRKKLEGMDLLDDFLFGSMLTYPGVGEPFVRVLLKVIFGREFGKLDIIPQKVYYGSDTDKHGARLDVYMEEPAGGGAVPGGAVVYDLEPDNNGREKDVRALPRRVRFYHAKIDAHSLKAGEDYSCLKNVTVVMITPYDPFGLDRMVYTISSGCREAPRMPYDDGALTIYLYTRGKEGDPPGALRELLYYLEHTTQGNAVNRDLQELQDMVEAVKHDEEVSVRYMKIHEREAMLVEQGREEERMNTEREKQRADKAEIRADAAETRADAAEARNHELEEKIRELESRYRRQIL